MLRLAAACLASSVALAQNYFSAALEGAQEVPPVLTSGRGWGIVSLDPGTGTVSVFLFHEGLSGPPTAAHLHLGAVGVSGGVILGLTAAGPNEFTGIGVLAAPEAAALTSGGTYLNVHTAANPNGEIRGQVVESMSTRYTGSLTGAQVVPPTPFGAAGTAVAYLHEPENRIVYMVNTSGLALVTGAHFHQAPAGVNGPVIADLNGAGFILLGVGGSLHWGVTDRLPEAQLAAWKANGCYVDIHMTLFPNGVIRAQMLQDNVPPATLPRTFGEGCPGSSGVRPQIGARGSPSVGNSIVIDLYGAAPNSLAFFDFGASRDSIGFVPLPIALGTIGIGSPNCYLFIDPVTTQVFPITWLGCSSVVLNVPSMPALQGQSFYSQWFALDPAGIIASSALAMTIQ